MNKMGKGEHVSHSELLGTVYGSTSFQVTQYSVQPGLPGVFPWLATQAQRYQQYHVRKIQFEFITRTGTTTTGSVILAADYDASQPPPGTEQQVASYQGAIEDVPWRGITCNLDPRAIHATGPRKFIRDGNVPGDITSYDACNFFLCTTGMPNTDAIGKLWVHYSIELHVPQIIAAVPSSACFFYAGENDVKEFVTDNVAYNLRPPVIQNTFGATYDVKTGDILLPKGVYLVRFNATFAHGSAAAGEFRLYLATLGSTVAGSQMSMNPNGLATSSLSSQGYYVSDGAVPLNVTLFAAFASGNNTLYDSNISIICV
jgi:hypothetical protein